MTSLPVQRIIFSSHIHIHTLTHRKKEERVTACSAIRSIVAIATIAIQLLIHVCLASLSKRGGGGGNIASTRCIFDRMSHTDSYVLVRSILSNFEFERFFHRTHLRVFMRYDALIETIFFFFSPILIYSKLLFCYTLYFGRFNYSYCLSFSCLIYVYAYRPRGIST